jgi:hypothetical protein
LENKTNEYIVQQCYAIEIQSHQHRVKANRKEFKHKSKEAAKISKVGENNTNHILGPYLTV